MIYKDAVLFFTRILNFKRALLARLRNRRRQVRYRVGEEFPLMAMVNLTGDGHLPRKDATGTPGNSWNGRVSDLSVTGLSVKLPAVAPAVRNEATVVHLTVEGRELLIPGIVAHSKVLHGHCLCGLRLNFSDFTVQKAYLQIVEAVSLGGSFTPALSKRPSHVSLGLVRQRWLSLKHARLTEWRETVTNRLDRFELILEAHAIEGRKEEPGLVIRPETQRGRSVSPAVEAEIRQLYLWVVANLPATVPADLRKFMRSAAVARRGTRPPLPSKPPSEWAPPKRPARGPV